MMSESKEERTFDDITVEMHTAMKIFGEENLPDKPKDSKMKQTKT